MYNSCGCGFSAAKPGRSAGVARTFGVGEAGGSIPLVPKSLAKANKNKEKGGVYYCPFILQHFLAVL